MRTSMPEVPGNIEGRLTGTALLVGSRLPTSPLLLGSLWSLVGLCEEVPHKVLPVTIWMGNGLLNTPLQLQQPDRSRKLGSVLLIVMVWVCMF